MLNTTSLALLPSPPQPVRDLTCLLAACLFFTPVTRGRRTSLSAEVVPAL